MSELQKQTDLCCGTVCDKMELKNQVNKRAKQSFFEGYLAASEGQGVDEAWLMHKAYLEID